MKKPTDILNKYVKGDLVRDYNKQDLDYNTVYLSTTLKCIKDAQADCKKDIKELESALRYCREWINGQPANQYVLEIIDKALNKL